MRIERLTSPADLDAIVALQAQSFTNPWTRDSLAWELENSDVTRMFVARDGDVIVGFCACWVVFDEMHINTLAVSPERRRRGVARTLLRFAMKDAAATGATRATLEVRVSNEAALALYQGLGFRVAASRPRYYSNPDEDGLILWRDSLADVVEGE